MVELIPVEDKIISLHDLPEPLQRKIKQYAMVEHPERPSQRKDDLFENKNVKFINIRIMTIIILILISFIFSSIICK